MPFNGKLLIDDPVRLDRPHVDMPRLDFFRATHRDHPIRADYESLDIPLPAAHKSPA